MHLHILVPDAQFLCIPKNTQTNKTLRIEKYVFIEGKVEKKYFVKVEIFLEQREVAFLSASKVCENLNFSTEIQLFTNLAGL